MDGMNSTASADESCICHDTLNGLRDVVGDEALLGLMTMYQDESARMLTDIGTAMEAGDMQALERHVHLLKGVSSNFGLHRVVTTAEAAMAACREKRSDEAHAIAAMLAPLTCEAQSALKDLAATLV